MQLVTDQLQSATQKRFVHKLSHGGKLSKSAGTKDSFHKC